MKQARITLAFSIMLFAALQQVQGAAIWDVFANKSYEVRNVVTEYLPDGRFATKEIDIGYFSILDPDTKIEIGLNDKTYPLCLHYLQDQGEFTLVLNDLSSKIKVYNEVIMRSNNRERDHEIAPTVVPILDDVHCMALGIVAGQVFFKVDFKFRIPNGRAAEDLGFTVSHFFQGDLRRGQLRRTKNLLNTAALERIRDGIAGLIKNDYNNLINKNTLDEPALAVGLEGQEEADERSAQRPAGGSGRIDSSFPEFDVFFEGIDMSEADFYWCGWGMMMEFPDYSKTSKLFNGNGFRLFIPWHLAAALFGKEPGFDFLKNLAPSPSTLHDFNYYDKMKLGSFIRQIPGPLEVLSMNNPSEMPRGVTSKIYQVRSDSTQTYNNSVTVDLNPEGKLTRKEVRDPDGKTTYLEKQEHDDAGRLTHKTEIQNQNVHKPRTENFVFDDAGNLTEMFTYESGKIRYFRMFYNGEHVYVMQNGFFDLAGKDETWHASLTDKLCINNTCYTLDSKGRVIGLYSQSNARDNLQVGYDKQGRLAEAHEENDRYNYYFSYDEAGRLWRYQKFEAQTPMVNVKFKYEGDSRLPTQQVKVTTHYGSRSTMIETYEWQMK